MRSPKAPRRRAVICASNEPNEYACIFTRRMPQQPTECRLSQSRSAPNHTGDATLPLRWLPPATLLWTCLLGTPCGASCSQPTSFIKSQEAKCQKLLTFFLRSAILKMSKVFDILKGNFYERGNDYASRSDDFFRSYFISVYRFGYFHVGITTETRRRAQSNYCMESQFFHIISNNRFKHDRCDRKLCKRSIYEYESFYSTGSRSHSLFCFSHVL